MASGDVYELVDKQIMEGQEVLNVYYYKQTAPALVGNIPQQIADAWIDQVLPSITTIQTDNVTHTEVIVSNLFNPSETHTSVISEPGGDTGGDPESTFTAVGFRLVQDNGALRNGSKRYAGLKEGNDTSGVISDAGFITALVALGVSLIAGVDIGIVSNAVIPVIVGRILDGGSYRLPANSGEAVLGNVVDALYNLQETSQVSRKVGRGA